MQYPSIKSARALLACAALTVLATACDNKKEYVPAVPDSPDCMGVYFDPDNATEFIFIPGAGAEIDVTMYRTKYEAAADVPLIVTSNVDGIKAPSQAHFDAGSNVTSFAIDCTDMPLKTTATITVNVPDQYIDHYAATLFNYQASALVSEWVPANTDGSPVKVYFTSNDYGTSVNPKVQSAVYQPVECEAEILPGSGLIRLHNFINAGVDVTFSITPSPYEDFFGFYRVSPTNHWISMVDVYESSSYGDPWYNAWYLLSGTLDEDGEEDYATAQLTRLDGTPSPLEYPRFYWYSDSYAYEYSYMYPKSASFPHSSISMGFYGDTDDNDISIPDYFYVYFNWDGETGL